MMAKLPRNPEGLARLALAIVLLVLAWPVLLITPYWLLGQILFFALAAFLAPSLALFGIALLGPLFLRDPGTFFPVLLLEALVLGAVLRWLLQRSPPQPEGGRFFPALLAAFFLLLAGSVLPSVMAAFHPDQIFFPHLPLWVEVWIGATHDPFATRGVWGLRAFYNAMLGALVAWGIVTRVDEKVLSRTLKLAVFSLTVSVLFALAHQVGALDLSLLRPNHAEHAARLQGPAGHPGWYAQLFIVALPGFLLLFRDAGRRERFVLTGMLLLCVVGLVLTGARAAWIAAIGATALFLFIGRRRGGPVPWRLILGVGLASLGVIAILGLTVDVIGDRLLGLFRATDRVRYYMTSIAFLSEHPFGIGLGTHWWFYTSRVSWFHPYYQFDHVDAHSLYLHLLVENGPALLLVVVAMVAGVFFLGLRALAGLQGDDAALLLAALLAFFGMLLIGVFQHLPYLRVIDLWLWILAGIILHSARKLGLTMRLSRHGKIAVIFVALIITLFTFRHHQQRPWPDEIGRPYERASDETLTVWTRGRFETIVDQRATAIRFQALRIAKPASLAIEWPDGDIHYHRIEPDETLSFERLWRRSPSSNSLSPRFDPRWLRITVDPTLRPKDFFEESSDGRDLGIYLFNFAIEFAGPTETQSE